jgi:hypothetical protein
LGVAALISACDSGGREGGPGPGPGPSAFPPGHADDGPGGAGLDSGTALDGAPWTAPDGAARSSDGGSDVGSDGGVARADGSSGFSGRDGGHGGALDASATGQDSGAGFGDAAGLADAVGFADAATPAPFPSCWHSCGTPDDCATAGAPSLSASHWSCDGVCHYLGCQSVADCPTSGGQSYVCVSAPGSIPACIPACATPSDCVTAGVPIFQAANYACRAGLCQWTGCLSDQECRDTYSDPRYLCRQVPGWTLQSCFLACTAPSDCVSANASVLLDADNYACDGGLCTWTGCRSTAECTAAYSSSAYVCE